ncbi:MAG: hypothetical protein JSW46_02905 [Gemmatimonadota bacterium]|nr:MAG: hypothetical protein JSW46_02905 [Gemmatimonadota bacterium]
MYKTCIYCHRNLGENESVENFPVGRRLAFDAEKGRLWVVCDNCRRWNLTPLEERWEAIEECERYYRETTIRYSTDNIGLAQLGEGLDLVRIGRPQRPEFAAWRYGRQFVRRRLVRLARDLSVAAGAIAAHVLGVNAILWFVWMGSKRRIVVRVTSPEGKPLPVAADDIKEVRLVTTETPEGWGLSVPYRTGIMEIEPWRTFADTDGDTAVLVGPTAVRAAGKLLPKVNTYGGSTGQVRDAVGLIEDAGSPERLYRKAAREEGYVAVAMFDKDASIIGSMHPQVRLALEMAAHEEAERRALEEELKELERDWRDAEMIAAIADRLLVPEDVEEWIRKNR